MTRRAHKAADPPPDFSPVVSDSRSIELWEWTCVCAHTSAFSPAFGLFPWPKSAWSAWLNGITNVRLARPAMADVDLRGNRSSVGPPPLLDQDMRSLPPVPPHPVPPPQHHVSDGSVIFFLYVTIIINSLNSPDIGLFSKINFWHSMHAGQTSRYSLF